MNWLLSPLLSYNFAWQPLYNAKIGTFVCARALGFRAQTSIKRAKLRLTVQRSELATSVATQGSQPPLQHKAPASKRFMSSCGRALGSQDSGFGFWVSVYAHRPAYRGQQHTYQHIEGTLQRNARYIPAYRGQQHTCLVGRP